MPTNAGLILRVTHEEDECLFASWGGLHGIVTESHADEDDSENRESHELIVHQYACSVQVT